MGEARREVRILFTCTANRVRSPFAEAAARARLAALDLPAEVRSAGLLEAGRPPIEEMVDAARRVGVDIAEHRSETVIAEDLRQADLVVTMTGEHVVALVGIEPAARPRILTLREWAGAAERGAGLTEWSPGAVRNWADRIVAARGIDEVLSGRHDIADPMGGPRRGYRRAVEIIDEALAVCLAPVAAPDGAG